MRVGIASFGALVAERTHRSRLSWPDRYREAAKARDYPPATFTGNLCVEPDVPKELDTIAHELNRLSDYLSSDHDLALLRSRAVRQGELLGDSSESRNRLCSLTPGANTYRAKD